MSSGRSEQTASASSQSGEASHTTYPIALEDRGTVVSDVRESIVTIGDGNQVLIGQLHVHFEPSLEPSPEEAAQTSRNLPVTSSVIAPSVRRSRELLIGKVHDFWIRGVLETNLHGATAVQLGFKPQPQALSNPWELLVEQTEPPCPELPLRPTIFDLYSASRGRLLIVGAAGCGKTTLLLQLAQVLSERAKSDLIHPIPVILTLGTWTSGVRNFADWLQHELNERYDVPERVSRQWLREGELTLLLDGLEELAAAERPLCIVAINDFLRDKPCGLVVCAREVEYSLAETRLRLNAAVRIEPLSEEGVKSYVAGQGTRLAALQSALDADVQLLTLAQTPLFLNIMILAYEGSDEPAALDQPVESKREEVLRAYVQKMTKEGRRPTRFSARQTTHWLTNLAARMMANNLPVFDFHHLQSGWLQRRREQRTFGITLDLMLRLFTALCFGVPTGINVGCAEGLLFAFLGFLSPARSKGPHRILPVRTLGWSNTRFQQHLYPAFKNGMTWGSLWGVLHLLEGNMTGAVFWMLSIGLASAVADSLLGGLEAREVGPSVEPGMVIWKSARSALLAGTIAAVVGSVVAVLLLMAGRYLFGLQHDFRQTIILWLSIGFITTAFQYGGKAFLEHWLLRFLLWSEGSLPLNLQRFLDHVVRRTFMCRVGEGYIFVHRLPMEYFATKKEPAEHDGEFAIGRRGYFATAALLIILLAALAGFSGTLIVQNIRVTSHWRDGSTQLQNGQYKESIASYNAVLDVQADHPWALLGRGFSRLKLGQYDLAIADFSQGLLKVPNDPDSYFFRGLALRETGKWRQALQDFQRAAELKSQQPELNLELGIAFVHLSQPEKAKPPLTEYVRFATTRLAATPPQDANWLIWRGAAYLLLQKHEKALADFDQLLNSDLILKADAATGQRLHILRGHCFIGLGRYEDALALFRSFTEVPSLREEVLRGIANAYYLRGQKLESNIDFEAAIKPFEGIKDALTLEERLMLAKCYHVARREEDAIATGIAATKAADDDVQRANAWGGLSYHYLFERQFEKAISSAQESMHLNPELKIVLTNLAHAYLLSGREEAARRLYRENQPLSFADKSWAYWILKDFEELKSRGISHPAMAEIEVEMRDALRDKSAVH